MKSVNAFIASLKFFVFCIIIYINKVQNMTTKERFKNDDEGKEFFSRLLKSKGYKQVTITPSGCSWDIEATYKNTRYYFELKVRYRQALDGKYNDTICEPTKLHSVPDIDHGYIVNFFDDCYTVIPYTSTHNSQNRYCQKTNNWNKTKVPKILISYPNEIEYMFSYND